MLPRTRKKKSKVAKRLAITSAMILLLTYAVKEVLKENLKELQGSLASAEAQYRTELDQSTISLQILAVQEQIENLKLESERGRKDPNRDFSGLIAQDTARAQQVRAHLDSSLDSVSRLIDKFPSGAQDLRKLRDQVRQNLEKTDEQITGMLKARPEHDVGRLVEVKIAMVLTLVQEVPVAVLGDVTLTAAHRVQEAAERLIRVCTWATYILFVLGLGMGLYATLGGHKIEAAE
jgi:hypothetical protein